MPPKKEKKIKQNEKKKKVPPQLPEKRKTNSRSQKKNCKSLPEVVQTPSPPRKAAKKRVNNNAGQTTKRKKKKVEKIAPAAPLKKVELVEIPELPPLPEEKLQESVPEPTKVATKKKRGRTVGRPKRKKKGGKKPYASLFPKRKREPPPLSEEELLRRSLPEIEVPIRERKVEVEDFYRDVLENIIVFTLRCNLSDENDFENNMEAFRKKKIVKVIAVRCLRNLCQILKNACEYVGICEQKNVITEDFQGRFKRKKLTIEDFEKGLNFYPW